MEISLKWNGRTGRQEKYGRELSAIIDFADFVVKAC